MKDTLNENESWKEELIHKYLVRLSNAFVLSQHSKILVILDCDCEIVCFLHVLKEYLKVVESEGKMKCKLAVFIFEPQVNAKRKSVIRKIMKRMGIEDEIT